MKLTLAIVLCIGLYWCAVSAMNPEAPDHEGYKRFLSEWKYNEFMEFLENHDKKYQHFSKSYQGFEDYKESEVVEQKFPELIKMCKFSITSFSWDNLKCADQDFKKECIENFEDIIDSDMNNENLRTEHPLFFNYAPEAVLKGVNEFLQDLKNSGINEDAKTKLFHCQHENSLEFMYFWFQLPWNEKDFKTEIENMKKKHHLGKDNDKAAKVMIMLLKFPQLFIIESPIDGDNLPSKQ